MKDGIDLNHLRTFQRVAEHGSLAEAARSLGVPTSTVSRHLSRLEDALGADLVHRGSRRVALTELGEAVLDRCRAPLLELAKLAEEPSRARSLRIAAPSNVATAPPFASMLVAYRRRHPSIEIDVDFSAWLEDPVESRCDVIFRPFNTVRDRPDLMVRRLPAVTLRLYAAPSYLGRRARPSRVEELREHEMVVPRFLLGRPLILRRGKRELALEPKVAFVGDDLSFVLPLLEAGAGYGIVPEREARARVELGRLERILPGWRLPSLSPAMVWPRRRFLPPRTRAFIDFVADRLGAD